jgi:DNA helicase-2/ATP-dependent DNA helicase PcrA
VNWATTRGLDAGAYVRAVSRGEYHPATDNTRVAGLLDAYAAAKHERGEIDLDDLLLLTADELATDPVYRAAVQWRYRHVLVDEAQDLNPLQHRLVRLLAEPGDLFLVGDPAQAIYGFNGADPALLVEVEHHFPGIEVVRLPVNHRSTPQVVAAGAHVLAGGAGLSELADSLVSARPDGPRVDVVAADDDVAEAQLVVRRLANADPGLVRGSRVAVLARTHATLTELASALDAAGIAVRHSPDGPNSALTPYLRLAYRIADSNRLRRWAHDHLEEAAELVADGSPAGTTASTAAAIAAVARAVLDYLGEQPTGDGTGLKNWVGATDPFGADTGGVELLTFHAAKGREWHTVLLVGCESSLVPHRSARTQLARAEEARLLYVAITRATDEVTITWARRRGGYQRKPSPFLDGFTSTTPPAAPPPAELLARHHLDHDDLSERLHQWRADAARAADLLPDTFISDRDLATIAVARPTNAEELDAATGLGPLTSRRLWPGLAEVLGEAVTS